MIKKRVKHRYYQGYFFRNQILITPRYKFKSDYFVFRIVMMSIDTYT